VKYLYDLQKNVVIVCGEGIVDEQGHEFAESQSTDPGGNVVFTRAILSRVGPYTTWLGRTDKGLLTGEDEELYGRLLANGAKGMYLPHLIIYHHIPPERVTKSYFRRWCFWRGVSLGLLDRTRKLPCAYLFGIPRWHYRNAFRGFLTTAKHVVVKPRNPAQAFAAELGVWDWLGLLYGRHFRKDANFKQPSLGVQLDG